MPKPNTKRALRTFAAGSVLLALTGLAPAQELDFVTPEPVADALRRASLTASVLDAEDTASAQDLVAAARADYRRLLTALYAEGYYGGSVSILIDGREASTIAPLDAPSQVARIEVRVDPGPQFRFGRAEVAPLAEGTAIPEGFATGHIAKSAEVQAALTAAIEAWRNEGHAKASLDSQQITARHADTTLDAVVTVDPGAQNTFGPLTVTGNTDVRADRIAHIAGLPVGQVFSPDQLERAANRLRRTGAFSSVAMIEADTANADNSLPITAQVAELPPRRIGFGAEVSSVDGMTLSGYWLHRNFLGGAEQFRVDAEVAGIAGETGGADYSLGATLDYPRPFAVDTTGTLALSYDRLDEPSYFLEQITGEATVARLIRDDRTISVGLGFVTAETEDSFGERTYSLLTLPLSGTIDRRDSTMDAKTGWYADLDITPFLGFGDAGSGGRIYGDGRYYQSFGADRQVTLAVRGQMGSVVGVSAAQAPADYLFFSGGGGTVRGQSYQSLGVDNGGTTIGGLSLAAISTEARVSVTDSIGVVGFFDAGWVGAQSLPFDDANWHSGAGVGLRYDTGIGPIRLDVATPASGDTAGRSVNVYIGIGQSF